MSRVRARRTVVAAVVTAALLLTAACTSDDGDDTGASDDTSTDNTPTENGAESPGATEPVEPAEFELGEPASLIVEPGPKKSSDVELTVLRVDRGKRKDLKDFVMSGDMEKATPYYATVRVKNVGQGDLSRSDITLWGLDSTETVRPPAEIMGTFGKCDHTLMPRKFTNGERAQTCLTYLLPEDATLDAVQYRFNDDRPPYSWPVG